MIQEYDFHQIYIQILEKMLAEAQLVGKTKLIDHLTFTLLDPRRSLINHKKNWAWAFHEGINRFSWEHPHLLNPGTAYHFRPNWKRKLEKEGGTFCYSYGNLYRSEVGNILRMLRSKSQREAIITLWSNEYLKRGIVTEMPRRPCTLILHFYFIKTDLYCNCLMRTSDVMNLLPYDVFHHTLLQRYLASVLDVGLGHFHFTASFAYYQKKRDITGSVKNTLTKLIEADPPETELNDWQFGEEERISLMNLTELMINEKQEEIESTGFLKSIEELSSYGQLYAQALLYCFNNKQFSGMKEFEVIYK